MADVHLSRPAYVLGRPEPVTATAIDDTDEVAAALVAAGFPTVHRSPGPCWRMAAEAAARVLGPTGTAVRPDLTILCTETWFEEKPAVALSRLVTGLGIGDAPGVVVGGNDCANLVAGLALAAGEVERGRSTVLVATADRMAAGETRSYQDGLALMSDGAAACLVTAAPLGDGYRILASAQRSSSTVDADGRDVVDARTSLRDVRAAIDEVLERGGAAPSDLRWVVMNHYRDASAEFVVRAAGLTGVPRARAAEGPLGHCYAADAAIGLAELLRGPELVGGDLVLVLGDGARARSALLLEAHRPPVP